MHSTGARLKYRDRPASVVPADQAWSNIRRRDWRRRLAVPLGAGVLAALGWWIHDHRYCSPAGPFQRVRRWTCRRSPIPSGWTRTAGQGAPQQTRIGGRGLRRRHPTGQVWDTFTWLLCKTKTAQDIFIGIRFVGSSSQRTQDFTTVRRETNSLEWVWGSRSSWEFLWVQSAFSDIE